MTRLEGGKAVSARDTVEATHACDRFTGAGSSLCSLVSLNIATKVHVQYFVFIKSMQSATYDGKNAELSHPACKKLHTRAKARKSNVAKAPYQRSVHVTLFGYRRLLTRQGTVPGTLLTSA